MLNRVANRTCNLRGTAQRIGVLNNAIALAMRRHYFTSLQCCKHVCGTDCLARVWAQVFVELCPEHLVCAQLPLNTHGRNQVGLVKKLVRIAKGQNQHSQHAVGAVDKRKPLFFAQLHRFDAGLFQQLWNFGLNTIRTECSSLSHKNKCAMGKRS